MPSSSLVRVIWHPSLELTLSNDARSSLLQVGVPCQLFTIRSVFDTPHDSRSLFFGIKKKENRNYKKRTIMIMLGGQMHYGPWARQYTHVALRENVGIMSNVHYNPVFCVFVFLWCCIFHSLIWLHWMKLLLCASVLYYIPCSICVSAVRTCLPLLLRRNSTCYTIPGRHKRGTWSTPRMLRTPLLIQCHAREPSTCKRKKHVDKIKLRDVYALSPRGARAHTNSMSEREKKRPF